MFNMSSCLFQSFWMTFTTLGKRLNSAGFIFFIIIFTLIIWKTWICNKRERERSLLISSISKIHTWYIVVFLSLNSQWLWKLIEWIAKESNKLCIITILWELTPYACRQDCVFKIRTMSPDGPTVPDKINAEKNPFISQA